MDHDHSVFYHDPKDFKSKLDFAIEHIKKAPHLKNRCGVVLTDSWYSSKNLINTAIQQKFEGIFALKKNRKVKYMGKNQKVSEIALSQDTNFNKITVKEKEYRVWTSKVILHGVLNEEPSKPRKLRLFISQLKLSNNNWSDYKYLIVTDMAMNNWIILDLYCKRWTIETFYRFAKNAFDFKGSQLRTHEGALRYFILLFFAFTYLTLTKYPHYLYDKKAKSHFEAMSLLEKETIENLVTWIYNETKNGVDLDDIKLKLGF